MLSQYFPLMKMARRRRIRFCWPSSSCSKVEKSEDSQVLIGKRVSCLPSSKFHFKFSLRLRHVILTTLFLLTLCHHIPCANSQPLLNQLAVLLRARPPWPTSFPTTASQQQANNVQQQQQQQQSPSSIQQQISVQSSHVYPTSSEQLQNFIASNNLAQGPLSQGIPVVAMDPSQNSITIMTPTGPEQIMAPSPSGMGGGGVFVAQPIHQNDNTVIHNNGTATNNANNVQSTNVNGNNNNNTPPGTIVQVMPNPVTFDSQSLMDGSVFAAAAAGIPPLPQSGSSNIAFPGFPGNFPNDQLHMQASYPAGFIVHGGHTGQGQNINNQPILNSQPQVVTNNLPLPPPIPKNLKGPAIIAVPKSVAPSSTYMGGPVETNLQHLSSNPPASGSTHGTQPIIIHSFHQLPNLTPAFPQIFPPVQSYPHESMISLPENAMINNLNLELNKTNVVRQQLPLQPLQPQQIHTQQQMASSHFLPSQQDRTQQQFFIEHKQEQSQSQQQTQQPEKIQPSQPEKQSFAELSRTELSSEMVGNPRNQRKRHHKQRQFHQQLQQTTRRGLFRRKPTSRPTQIPQPAETESNQNEIDNNNNKTPSMLDYSLSTIINLPSTTITGSFEYPDPPTPPNFESMNALKYPSPFEDSAEVAAKSESLSSSLSSTSSRERKRLRDELQEQLKSTLHLHNSPFSNNNGVTSKRVSPTFSSTTTTAGTHALEASSVYRRLTTASALPETSEFEPIRLDIRETTTFPASSTTIKKRHHRRKGKSTKSRKDFRPSPQIHSFEEPVTGIKSYITILPPVTTISGLEESEEKSGKQRGKKSLFAKFEANESKHPPYEVGFKPVSHYTTLAVGNTNTMPAATTTSESLYFDLIREVVSKAPSKSWSKPDLTGENQRQHRLLVTSADGLTITNPFISSTSNNANYGFTTLSSTSSTDPFVKAGWKVKDHVTNSDDSRRQLTTSASSEVEDWRFPDTTHGSKDSSSVYFGNGKFGPPNCDKFHRFGFCPMNSGYPTDQVEKIASRCSALLSHLIAPLPKADVRYDVIVAKNGSMLKGKSAAPSGWSWKSFSGKPVCDTKEIKVVPGWAKNERGEWLVILQTKAWKQEAQITLCTPQGTHYNCKGSKSSGNKNNKDCTPIKIKCVQRFTAQRLAVLDPENTDRCPVLRSVFLPSACVCLHDGSPLRPSSSSSLGSSEEISTGSSNTNVVKISSKGGKGSRDRSSSKGSRKGSKGKRSSKKSSSSKRNKKPSTASGRSARKSNVNTPQASSSEEEENRSDMLDTAADSSTSGVTTSGLNSPTTTETLEERTEQRHQEENSAASSEDEDDNEVHDRGPHAEQLISSPAPTGTEEDESTDGQNNQNEVDDDDDENNVVDSARHSTTVSLDKNEDNGRITSTVTSNSHGGSGTTVTDETSISEEGENFEDKKGGR